MARQRARRGFTATALLLSAALAAALAAGCTRAPQERPRIGFALRDFNPPFGSGLRRAVETASAGRATLSLTDAGGQQPAQDSQIESLIAGGALSLVVALASPAAADAVVSRAKEAKTPLVFVQSRPSEEEMISWDKVYYAGTDPEEAGERAGEILAAWWKSDPGADRDRDGAMRIAFLPSGPEGGAEALRAQAAIESLGKAGVAAAARPDGASRRLRSDAGAAERLAALLADAPEALLCGDAALAVAAADAAVPAPSRAGAGAARMGIVAFETSTGILDGIAAGKILGAAVDDAEGIGTAAFRLALVLARGQDVSAAGYAISDAKYAWVPCLTVTGPKPAASPAR